MRYEIQRKRDQNAPGTLKLLEWVVGRLDIQHLPPLYSWYIAPYDVQWTAELFDMGSRSTLHHGAVVGQETSAVAVKRLFESRHRVQSAETFVREAEIWTSLSHPHVIPLYGACHLASPPFFVCESAGEHRNFVDYFSDGTSERRSQLWRHLYEAALGLQYLHERGVVHGSVKCRNLLVGADSKTKLCDFGLSVTVPREHPSSDGSANPVRNLRWMSPETLTDAVPPSFASDMFSFGMAVIEAVSGNVPWKRCSDEEVLREVADGERHPRPKGFADTQWAFVQALCDSDPQTRMQIDDVVEALKVFMNEERATRLASISGSEVVETAAAIILAATGVANESGTRIPDAVDSATAFADEAEPESEVSEAAASVNPQLGEIPPWLNVVAGLQPPHHDQKHAWMDEWTARCEPLAGECKSKLESLCPEMRENEGALSFLASRLMAVLRGLLRRAPLRAQDDAALAADSAAASAFDIVYAKLLGFMEKQSPSSHILYRVASSRVVVAVLRGLQEGVFELARMCSATDGELDRWLQEWTELIIIRASSLEIQVEQLSSMSDLLPDRSSQEEALVLLTYEMAVEGGSRSTDPAEKLIGRALEKAKAVLKIDVDGVPDWFIASYEVAFDSSSLGQGSFASAHLGRFASGQRVVVKALAIGGLGSARSYASFMHDVGEWKTLHHDHILTLHGASHVGTRAFLVLEHADHGNLLSYLENDANRSMLARLFFEAAQGLEYLHSQNIRHGHLRCCNILVSGEQESAKLADFGFDSVRSAVNALGGSNVSNAIQWMSPEHFEMEEGSPSLDADIFSLGMCMVEALARAPPWGELDEMDVLDSILDSVIPPRPADTPDDIWELIVDVLTVKPALKQVITRLADLAGKHREQV